MAVALSPAVGFVGEPGVLLSATHRDSVRAGFCLLVFILIVYEREMSCRPGSGPSISGKLKTTGWHCSMRRQLHSGCGSGSKTSQVGSRSLWLILSCARLPMP